MSTPWSAPRQAEGARRTASSSSSTWREESSRGGLQSTPSSPFPFSDHQQKTRQFRRSGDSDRASLAPDSISPLPITMKSSIVVRSNIGCSHDDELSRYVQQRAWINDQLRSIVVGRVMRLFRFNDLFEAIAWSLQLARLPLCNKESHGPMKFFPIRVQLSLHEPFSIEGEDLDKYIAGMFSRSRYEKLCGAKPRGSCCCGSNGRKCCCDC